ncbi:MAG TPA: sigma factor-like helix-turn-helix DNA-binding protein [Acidimicrobiia bacterium]|nr:sigma factor-like helix-turn-helix DNA-binding protein [Acidimicrobiia bacterium]
MPSSDESWPYQDLEGEPAADDEVDLDILELRADPRAYSDLTPGEREVLFLRFGMFDGRPHSMKEIGHSLELTHSEARDVLGRAIEKVRHRLVGMDGRL